MITLVPFKRAVNAALCQYCVCLLNAFSDRRHHRIARFGLFVAKAQINHRLLISCSSI